jgi:hypothetical protein
VWACFCASGQGYIYIFNQTLDAKLMKKILSDHLVESAKLHFSFDPPEQWYLLHDNDKKFKSRLVTGLLHESGVTALEFPPYSPDLNPLENLWATLARAVEQYTYQCDSMLALQDVIADEWLKISDEHMKTLAHSMPARCQAVIDAKGWYTHY